MFADLLAEAGVTVHVGRRLASVTKAGNRIVALSTQDGQVYRGLMYLDASYEGDLMALAGVASTVGREGNAAYGESINGVQLRDKHQFTRPVDPYVTPGSPASGLLPGISPAVLAPNGTADGRVQAYNFRMCLTQSAGRVAFPRPDGYDAGQHPLRRRGLGPRPGRVRRDRSLAADAVRAGGPPDGVGLRDDRTCSSRSAARFVRG